MKNIIEKLISKKKTASVAVDEIVYNVDNFNIWFCHKENKAVYANSGIFLRLDKLSHSHVIDYLQKSFNIENPDYSKVVSLYEDVRKDWLNKLNQ